MRHQIRWTQQKIAARLEELAPLTYRQRKALAPFRFRQLDGPSTPPSTAQDVEDSSWDEIEPDSYWGLPRTNFILRTRFNVPTSWGAAGPSALYLPIGISGDFSHPEALAYIDGEPFAACDRHHQEIILPAKWCDGKEHTLALHGWTGIGGQTVGDPTRKLQMRLCEVVQIDQPARDFIALARVALGIAKHLKDRQPARHHLLTALNDAFTLIDLRLPIGDAFYESIGDAFACLKAGVGQAGPSLDVDITAIGHAHIDVAWLWTLGQTRQKAGRSFHTVLRLMEQFPAYQFTQSQPQLYEYVHQDFPELFEAIKERIEDGRWEPIGGMWVEADCNLTGSESLARQFLLGRSYFREQFGKEAESPVLWLPDVFGYAWNLPQLIKESGLEYFFTIKIGWSQYNRLPYDSFWWQGLDGTRVLTHFSTTKNPASVHAATYNADASPGQTLGTWFNFQGKDDGPVGEIPPLLMSFGWGDGGGGPTREMLENIREMGDFPSTPPIHNGKVIDFFHKLEKISDGFPVWNSELYMEYHRGTYTTQAANKRANRKSEFLLHDTEFLAAYASLLDEEYAYPHVTFKEAWEIVCLNQFHDIIPGSSINPVYKESLEQYEQVHTMVSQVRDQALDVIANQFGSRALIVNPTSFTRHDLVDMNDQPVEVGAISPYSVVPLAEDRRQQIDHPSPVIAHSSFLENDFLRVEFNNAGDITRIYDKAAQRELLPEGALSNQLQLFDDRPMTYDAWDIDIYYDDKMWLAEPATRIEVVESGPLRATLEITRRMINSEITQRISLSYNSPRLDFDTHVDWRERKILLKVAFPVDVLSPTATHEIQWGNVERPTHRNTSWDWARFETAAQKWVDLSEGGYGVSLLNDCKYGHDIYDNVIRLTLLRGATAPDPEADLGQHEFKYSLYPHIGRWNENTISEAYALNDPVFVYKQTSDGRPKTDTPFPRPPSPVDFKAPFIEVASPNIIIETIKQAEDGKGVIVRLYESQRQRGPFTLSTNFPLKAAWRANILEENQAEIPVDDQQLQYHIKPYQIITLRLEPQG